MERQLTVICIATLVSTLHEVGDAPSGVVYAGLMTANKGLTLEEYESLVYVLERGGMIMQRHNMLSLTEKGHELAKRIDATVAKKQVS